MSGFLSTGGPTLQDADVILDFASDGDILETIGGLTIDRLNIFQGSGDFAGDTILQDKDTGEFLVILLGIDRNEISADDNTHLIRVVPEPSFAPSPSPVPSSPSPVSTPTNVPPIANDDVSNTLANTAVTLNLTANDTDSDGAIVPSTAIVLSEPIGGSLLNNGDGRVTYTPNLHFTGTDTFTYTVNDNDGATSNTATIRITVALPPTPPSTPTPVPTPPPTPTPIPTNVPPIANNDTASTPLGNTVTLDLAANDIDSDGTIEPTTLSIATSPSNGSLVNNGDGTVTYTPDALFAGTDTFTYTVEDDGGATSNIATATVTVVDTGIRGSKWNDLDSDGVRDVSEPGLAGWTIYLDANDNGILDSGETSTVTDANGDYAFTGLTAGTYTVAERPQRGWRQTAPGTIAPGSGTAGNIWVSRLSQHEIEQYSPTGMSLGGSISLPNAPASFQDGRGIVPDNRDNGLVHIYNGTFDPLLSTYNTSTGTFSDTTFSGWSTVNNTSYGDIASFREFVYATDMATSGASERGIVQFDLDNNTAVRFADTQNYIDLTLGLDGWLYALRSDQQKVDTFAPSTLELLWTTTLAEDVRGIAVNERSEIFGASWDDNIYHFDYEGTQLKAIDSGTFDLMDIDLSYEDDRIVVGSRSGDVILTDESLSSVTSFDAGNNNLFVSFSDVQTPWQILNPTHSVTLAVGDVATDVNFGGTFLGTPRLSIDDVTLTETDAGTVDATFTVTLSSVQAAAVTVDYATADDTATAGSDYTASNGTLTFAPGTTTQTLSVPVRGDTLAEGEETFNVDLTNATTGVEILDDRGVGTIEDNDFGLLIDDVSVTRPTSGTETATFTVSLTSASSNTITVDFETTDDSATEPSDYTATSGTLSFPPGTTTRTIDVTIKPGSVSSPSPVVNGEIRGSKWNDLNGNGLRDAGEPGLPNWTIFLDSNLDGVLDSGETSTVTDANGNYAFTNLTPSNYVVAEVQQPSSTQTFPGVSSMSAVDFIPVSDRRDLVFDPTRDRLYITTSGGTLERYDVATNTLLSSWSVGTNLNGADITPDGKFLYVAEEQTVGSEGFLLKVDLNTGAVTSIPYTRKSRETGAWDVAIAGDGTGFFTTRFAGSGWTPLRQFDLATDTLTVRMNVRQNTHIRRSADRSLLYFSESNSSAGPTLVYDATNSGSNETFSVNLSNASNATISDNMGIGTIQLAPFPARANMNSSLSNAVSGVSRDGSFTAIERYPSSIRIFDRDLNPVDTLTGFDGGFGFDPARDILYAIDSGTDEIVAHDLATRNELYRFAVGENISGFGSDLSTNLGSGNFAFSPDGDLMFLSTPTGIRVYDLPELGNHSVKIGSGEVLSGIEFGNQI
ncbi:MAG: tandem-95 repeat protein [Cyanobacteria bacterium SID2]|nr:tandem-95 repeat protein [Cyanobacteria bacterium SID2]